MTDNTKVISKPKVRFCQFSDNARNKGEIFKHCKEQVILQANNPRIKEIVSLKKPIRIVNPTKSNVCDKDESLNNCNNCFVYPLDENRKIFMFSDTPLFKCIRNRLHSKKQLKVCEGFFLPISSIEICLFHNIDVFLFRWMKLNIISNGIIFNFCMTLILVNLEMQERVRKLREGILNWTTHQKCVSN